MRSAGPPASSPACIDRWKNKGLAPSKSMPARAKPIANGRGAELYAQYQDRLKALNACDFGDLLLHMLVIFRTHADVLERYRTRFKYLLVDEYQDTNAGPVRMAEAARRAAPQPVLRRRRRPVDLLLARGRGRQHPALRARLSGRGGDPARAELPLDPPHPRRRLGLIANNSGRLGKTLWTEVDTGEKVKVVGVWDGPEEARRVGEEAEQHQRRGSLNDIAILVRAQFQTREFEERFIAIGLPYQIVGGFRFYERAEIRDALAYLRLVQSPSDDLAFERIVNTPKRGLGDKAVATIHRYARAAEPAAPARRRADARFGRAHPAGQAQPRPLRRRLRALAADAPARPTPLPRSARRPHAELARQLLDESGYTAMLQAERTAEATGRLENLAELTRAMEEYENLPSFLEHVSLVMDNDADKTGDKVTIMTIHAAKGLEFPIVYLAGWEEGVFPSQRALDEGGTRQPRGRTPPGLRRDHPRTRKGDHLPRRQPPHLRPVDQLHPQPLRRRTAQRACRGRDHHDRRRKPVARAVERAWRSLRPCRRPAPRPPVDPRPRLRPRGADASTAVPQRIVEARASAVSLGNKGRDDLSLGQRVFHGKFGYGVIAAIEGNKLEIDFEHAGRKRVLDSFVSLG